MNKEGVNLESWNPFDFIRQQQAIAKRVLEEDAMTYSAREQVTMKEQVQAINESVQMWLRLNQELMIKEPIDVKTYMSQYMRLKTNSVRGVCYVVGRISAAQ